MTGRRRFLTLIVLGIVLGACGGDPAITISNAVVVEPNGPNAAAYLDIDNPTEVADRLTSVSVTGYAAMLHETSIAADGQATMQPVEAIEVRPGETVSLRPGTLHVMIMGADGVAAGDELELTFEFETMDAVTKKVEVMTLTEYLAEIEAK